MVNDSSLLFNRINMTFIFWTVFLALTALMGKIESIAISEDNGPVVHEVKEGDTAVFPCPSNDLAHRFIYWERTGSDNSFLSIGPGHKIDKSKYKYEVLEGTLYIRAVTKEEEGPYICVSQNLEDSSFYARPVDLVVKQDWEELWENDYETNLLRGWIAFIVIGALLICAYMAFRYRRRSTSRFRTIPDEEAQDDSGAAVELTSPSTNFNHNGDSDPAVDTDFPKAFNAMYRPMGGVEARL